MLKTAIFIPKSQSVSATPNFKIRRDGKNKMLLRILYNSHNNVSCSSVSGHIRKLGVGRVNNGKNYFTKNIILNLLNFYKKPFNWASILITEG